MTEGMIEMRWTCRKLSELVALPIAFLLVIGIAVPLPAVALTSMDPTLFSPIWENPDGHNANVWSVRWSPDGSMLSATYFDNTTIIFNSTTGTIVKRLEGGHHQFAAEKNAETFGQPAPDPYCETNTPHPNCTDLRCSAWSPDGKYLAVGSDERVVRLYETSTWNDIRVLQGHLGSILTLDWSYDGKWLASGSGRDKVRPKNIGENITKIWNATTWTCVANLTGHKDGVLGIRWSHNCKYLATASDDRVIKVWNVPAWTLLKNMTGHTSGVLDVTWSPDDTLIASGSRDYKLFLWDFAKGEHTAKWSEDNCVRSLDWNPKETLIVNGIVGGNGAKIRNAATGAVLKTLTEAIPTLSTVLSARWSPNGERIATGSGNDHCVRVYGIVPQSQQPLTAPNWLPGVLLLTAIGVVGAVVIFYPLRRRFKERRG